MLFAAVQYLLLSGLDHPLAGHYPIIAGRERLPGPALPRFRDFCLGLRERIADTLAVASAVRPAWQFAMEGSSPQLSVTRYRDGIGETEILADVSAHGWWIDWRLEKR